MPLMNTTNPSILCSGSSSQFSICHHKKMTLQKSTEATDMAMDLYDALWFFKNSLITTQSSSNTDEGCCRPAKPKEEEDACAVQTPDDVPTLQRMPTLPPRSRSTNTAHVQAVRSLKSCNPKLRHSLSSLDNYRSSSAAKVLQQTLSPSQTS